MKLVPTKASTDIGEDAVTLLPEDSEDMWHAYNLISPGDLVMAHAVRKVVQETKTGSTISERVHTVLAIQVKSTFFDPIVGQLQVSGTVKSENAYVSLGQYHTLDLEVSRPFTISKPEGWDSVAKDTLSESLSDDKDGAMAAVVMQEGIANICLISQFRTVIKQRVESVIPKKRSAASETSQGMRRFYDKTLTALLRTVNFDTPRPLLLASPGFVAADFKKYIADEGRDKSDKKLSDIPTRKKYVALVDKVRADGGDVRILSSDHESGQRLDMLGSIAAILSYPIHDLDEDEDEDDGETAAGDAGGETII
ncbi:protein DOM34-like protein [Colletotrichum higginsianum]|nr:protein DOM34-like protein [Colletotrichum higginsianum]